MNIMEYAKNADLNVPKCLADPDSNSLILFIKTDNERAKRIKESQQIMLDLSYNQEFKGIVISMIPVTQTYTDINLELLHNGVPGFVSSNNKEAIKMLKQVVEGKAIVEFYVTNEDLSIVSDKQIFNTDLSIINLERVLKGIE